MTAYRDDVPLAVVEAKRTKVDADAGIEQAKRYAQRLEIPVAYATNGLAIWEIEMALQLVAKLRKSNWTMGCMSTRFVTGSRTASSRRTGCAGCA